jgi:CBS domain containing-hemolysin-like protein
MSDGLLTALGLAAVVVLIAATGFFVAAEFAFVASRRQKFAEDAQQGDRKSVKALAVHKRLSFMLSGAQLGITVTSLVLGFIARPVIGDAIKPLLTGVGLSENLSVAVSVIVAFVLATIGLMVFGELAPKNLAIAKPEPVARSVAGSTMMFLRVAGPVVKLFDGAANRLLRLFGIEPVDELHGGVSAEELDIIVDSAAESGHLTIAQAGLLDRAIDFAALEASHAMVPWIKVVTISGSAGAGDLRDAMASRRSRFPVVDGDGRVTGVVHAKDLLGVDRSLYATTTVAMLMHQVVAVPEAASLTVVLALLRSHSTEMALVVDEYGGPAGIITLEDIVEELVGEIEDEYDPTETSEQVETAPGVWTVTATSRPDEIERASGFVLPDGEYDTVAGLLLDRLERLAEVGDIVVVDGVRIEVTKVDGYAIDEVQLSIDPDIDAGAIGNNEGDMSVGSPVEEFAVRGPVADGAAVDADLFEESTDT